MVGSRGLLVDVIRTSGAIRSGERSGRAKREKESHRDDRKEGSEERLATFSEKDASRAENSVPHLVLTCSNRADIQTGRNLRRRSRKRDTKENKIPAQEKAATTREDTSP